MTPGTGNINPPCGNWMTRPRWLRRGAQEPTFAGAQGTPCDISSPCDVFGVPYHISTPYVASWNFNVQQALTSSTALQVAYVGNRGIKLFSHRDINQSDPTLNLACNDNGDDSYRGCRQDTRAFVLNCTSGSGPCLPWARYANEMENLGSSFYNGLQVTLTQRAFNGLNFLAGYTWAHALITPLPTGPVIRKTTAPSGQSGKWRLRYPPSLHFSMSYELPSLRAPLQMGQGWQLTSIVNLQTGEPYNYYDQQ